MPNHSFTIRRVGTGEADALAALSRRTFLETFAADNDPGNLAAYIDLAFDPHTIEEQLRTRGSEFYFAGADDTPLGYLKLNTGAAQTDSVPGKTLEIERIYLAGEAQGRGLGNALLEFALERARALGCEAVWLGVWERNHRAIAFYTKRGFVPFGTHAFVIGDDRQTDILMRIVL